VIGGLISDITWSGGDFIALKKNDSLVIRITRFILMLTVVLAVTMVIINGIQYITKSANGEDPSKTRWNLFYLVIGLLLALFSVVIINLFRSIGETTLDGIGDSSTYIQKQDTLPLA
jgi:cytochrome bd-type quinol oxidase subunit 2